MKSILCLGWLLGLMACGGYKKPLEIIGVPLELDPSIAIQAPNGNAGHACPVFLEDGTEMVLTARHVVVDEDGQYMDVVWSDGFGQEGYFSVADAFSAVDVVLLTPSMSVPVYLPKGTAKPGDTVFWFEYDFRTQANALRARRRFGKILRIVAQHFILDAMPEGGSSGTCLLNEYGEAVGLITSGWDTEDGKGAGVAVKFP